MTAVSLDVRDVRCPMTWVRAKLALERLEPGDVLHVSCAPGEAIGNVGRAAAAAGHAVSVEGTTVRILRA